MKSVQYAHIQSTCITRLLTKHITRICLLLDVAVFWPVSVRGSENNDIA